MTNKFYWTHYPTIATWETNKKAAEGMGSGVTRNWCLGTFQPSRCFSCHHREGASVPLRILRAAPVAAAPSLSDSIDVEPWLSLVIEVSEISSHSSENHTSGAHMMSEYLLLSKSRSLWTWLSTSQWAPACQLFSQSFKLLPLWSSDVKPIGSPLKSLPQPATSKHLKHSFPWPGLLSSQRCNSWSNEKEVLCFPGY